MPEDSVAHPEFFKSVSKYIREYFLESEDWYMTMLLLGGILLGTFIMVYLSSLALWWYILFTNSLDLVNFTFFLQSIELFCVVTLGYIGFNALTNYFTQILSTRWREWLTKIFIQKYIDIEQNEECLNAEERENAKKTIQIDIPFFVEKTLTLVVDFLKSIFKLIVFIQPLWLAGSLTGMVCGCSIVIPGYFALTAIVIGIFSTYLGYVINQSLNSLAQRQNDLEKDFTQEMNLPQENLRANLLQKLHTICANSYSTMAIKIQINSIQDFYYQFSQTFPYLIAAPMVFMAQIDPMQIIPLTYAFLEVQFSFNTFLSLYETFWEYKDTVIRLAKLDEKLQITSEYNCSNAATSSICERPQLRHRIISKNLEKNTHTQENRFFKSHNSCSQENSVTDDAEYNRSSKLKIL